MLICLCRRGRRFTSPGEVEEYSVPQSVIGMSDNVLPHSISTTNHSIHTLGARIITRGEVSGKKKGGEDESKKPKSSEIPKDVEVHRKYVKQELYEAACKDV